MTPANDMSGPEQEMKFDAGVVDALPSLADLDVSGHREVTLSATYWDTPDRRLMAWGCSLRHRVASDGSENGWTLKIPSARDAADLVARHEITSDAAPDGPPSDLLAIVRTVLLGESPLPAATITTQRSTVDVAGGEGTASVELSDDRVESVLAGKPGPSFREIEAELVGTGSRDLLDEVRDRLVDAGFRPARTLSKVQRVLGPRPTLLETPKRLPEDATVREFVIATIGASARQLLLNDPGVRLGADVEAIHQARVATRRLRSDLKTFGPLLAEGSVDLIRQEAAWLGDLLGQVRDPQVLEQRLTVAAASLDDTSTGGVDAVPELTGLLVERARFHHRQLVDAMDGDRYRALVADLLSVANDPPLATPKLGSKVAAPVVEQLARKQWKRARRFAARLDADATDVELHDVRKRLKRARYAAQSVKRLRLGSRSFRQELAELQDRLGDHHDLVVQREFLATDVGRLGPAAAFVAGRLLQDADHRRSAMRTEWPQLADRLDQLEFD